QPQSVRAPRFRGELTPLTITRQPHLLDERYADPEHIHPLGVPHDIHDDGEIGITVSRLWMLMNRYPSPTQLGLDFLLDLFGGNTSLLDLCIDVQHINEDTSQTVQRFLWPQRLSVRYRDKEYKTNDNG